MTKMIRRHALRQLGAGSLAGMLFSGAGGPGETATGTAVGTEPGGALVQGTLTIEHAEGRRLVGFIETGIRDGIALASLVQQHPENPAVESLFAAPERRGTATGVRVTVAFYSPPAGDVTFSLLHMAGPDGAAMRSPQTASATR